MKSPDQFYREFEDQHRGSRELITSRLQVYKPYIEPLLHLHTPPKVLDIGCGRGEWLELTQAVGFQVHGVDLDEHMLQACLERGLSVTHGDALAYLKMQSDASLSIVSGFHVAEHISFEELNTLLQETQRVLKPGGLLILETPNPENIAVATRHFYMDPTHVRPIPPMLLEFLSNFHSFFRTSLLRLQEPPDLQDRSQIMLNDVLQHVSPDYAVVAQKAAEPEVLAHFDNAFAQTLGVNLDNLAQRFDQNLHGLMSAHHETRQQTEAIQRCLPDIGVQLNAIQDHLIDLKPLTSLLQEVQHIRSDLNHLIAMRDEMQAILQDMHHVQSFQIQLQNAQAENRALRNSLSWKITAPLRGMLDLIASPASFAMRQVLKHPDLSKRINGWVLHFPSIHRRLRSSAIAQDMMRETPAPIAAAVCESNPAITLADLSPRARDIHEALLREQSRSKE